MWGRNISWNIRLAIWMLADNLSLSFFFFREDKVQIAYHGQQKVSALRSVLLQLFFFLKQTEYLRKMRNPRPLFLSVSNTSLTPFSPLRFKIRRWSSSAPLYLPLHSDLIWNFVVVLVVFNKTYTLKSQPAYTPKILIFPTYPHNSVHLLINPCSVQPLKCSSHRLPKFSITVDSCLWWSRFSSAILHYSFCLHLYHCTPFYSNRRQP